MGDMKLRTLPANHLIVLRGALDEAIRSLSKIERTSAVKACLAETLLILASSGEIETTQLGEVALVRVRRSCALCRGCEGVSPPFDRSPSPFQRHLSSPSGQKAGQWN